MLVVRVVPEERVAARSGSAAEPKRVAELRDRLHAWQREVGAQMATPNPAYNPAKPEYTPPPTKGKKAAAKG